MNAKFVRNIKLSFVNLSLILVIVGRFRDGSTYLEIYKCIVLWMNQGSMGRTNYFSMNNMMIFNDISPTVSKY